MHAATCEAFFEELDSIYELEKDAGVRDLLRAGTAKVKRVAQGVNNLSIKASTLGMAKTDDALSALRTQTSKIPKVGPLASKLVPKNSVDLMEKAHGALPPSANPNFV